MAKKETIEPEVGEPGIIKNASTGKNEKGYHSDFQKTHKVYSTDKDPHHKTGDSFMVHVNQVEGLVKKGLVTVDAPEEKKKGK